MKTNKSNTYNIQHVSTNDIMHIEKQLDCIFNKSNYTCKPANKEELQNIIYERISKYGNKCDLNDIDTSNITDMSNLFHCNYNFNGDISKWNVSNVTNMSNMFSNLSTFNSDISLWDVSNVINMRWMFNNCIAFNQDISYWNVGNVENMYCMFNKCENFNQNISNWNIANVEDIMFMFDGCINLTCDLSNLIQPIHAINERHTTCMFRDVKSKLPSWVNDYCK